MNRNCAENKNGKKITRPVLEVKLVGREELNTGTTPRKARFFHSEANVLISKL